jgi:hypothetical protein
MSFFREFYKPVNALFKNGFLDTDKSEQFAVALRTRASNNLKLAYVAERKKGPKGPEVKAGLSWRQKVTLLDKYDVDAQGGVDLEGTVLTNVELTNLHEDVIVGGGFQLAHDDGKLLDDYEKESKVDRDQFGVTATYKAPKYFLAQLALTQKKLNPLRAKFDASVSYEGLKAGVNGVVRLPISLLDKTDAKNVSIDELNYGVSLSHDDLTLHAQVEKKNTEARVAYSQRINRDLTVGGEYFTHLVKKESKFTVGGKVKLDENSDLQAKVDTNGLVGLAFSLKHNKNLSTTVAYTTNQDKPNEGKLGVQVSFDSE